MKTLKDVLNLTGEELTIEDYENAFAATPLVLQSERDSALTKAATLTKEKRDIQSELDTLKADMADTDETDNVKIKTLEDKIAKMEADALTKDAIALFIENGDSREYAESIVSMLNLSNGLENVETFIESENAKSLAAQKAKDKEDGKVKSPKAPNDEAVGKKRLKERYDQLKGDTDIPGMAAFKQDHPAEFAEFSAENK